LIYSSSLGNGKPCTINISHALDAQAHYARTGVLYKLHVLEGCAHAAWCYN
jgi:hypothetical protein